MPLKCNNVSVRLRWPKPSRTSVKEPVKPKHRILKNQIGKWELAPAYDVCHAYQPKHQWVSQHALSINGKRSDITKYDLLSIGKSIKNKKAAETIEEIGTTVSHWKTFAEGVEVSPKIRDEIAATLIR